MGSDGKIRSFPIGMTISTVGAIIAIEEYIKYKELTGMWISLYTFTCCALVITVLLFSRIYFVYRDDSLNNLTEQISLGPAKGLYTSKQHNETYMKVCEMLDDIEANYPDAKVFYSKLLPWAYLYTDLEYGTPTAWRTPISSPRLQEYYSLNPDKIPDIVVVFDDEIGGYDGNISGNQTPNMNELNGWFYNYLISNMYYIYQKDCATIFVNPNYPRYYVSVK